MPLIKARSLSGVEGAGKETMQVPPRFPSTSTNTQTERSP